VDGDTSSRFRGGRCCAVGVALGEYLNALEEFGSSRQALTEKGAFPFLLLEHLGVQEHVHVNINAERWETRTHDLSMDECLPHRIDDRRSMGYRAALSPLYLRPPCARHHCWLCLLLAEPSISW